jgi:hypothetical protein
VGVFSSIEVLLTIVLASIISIFFLFKKFKELQGRSNSCVLSKDWSAWGECSRNCGNEGWQFSTRTVLQLESQGGDPCRVQDMLRSQSCPGNNAQCGKACVPGNPDLYTWSSCPTCTIPGELPTQWKVVPPLSSATTGGQDCQISDVFFSRTCDQVTQACPPDIDCKLEFYASSSCALGPCENTGQTGLQFLYFRIAQQKSGRGKECDFRQLVQVVQCSDNTQVCDCNAGGASDWGSFSECNASCGPGISAALRKTPSPNCPNVSFTVCSYTACENNTCVPPSIDLVRAECYLLCAGLPTSTLAAGFCSTSSIFTEVCGNFLTGQGCAEPQDCSFSSWSAFGQCPQACDPQNLLGTVSERQRYIVRPSRGGGRSCDDPSFITQDFEPCANWVNVSYSAYDIETNNFVASVSLAQCFPQVCSYSDWYSITSCQNPIGCSNSNNPFGTITYNRSITSVADNCSTDPNFYLSYSNCSLPACIQCLWSDSVNITDGVRSFWCAQESMSTAFIPNILVSQTNITGVTCDQYQKSCSANENDPLVPGTLGTCSSFYWTCPSVDQCPADSLGRVCSGNGEFEYYFQNGSISCRCACFPQYSGPSCSTYEGSCPIASASGLVCNGMGDCLPSGTGFSCSCFNPLNTSSDCSGNNSDVGDRGWCWIFGTVKSSLPNDKAVTLKKLLGAQRISQQFTFESCTMLSFQSQQLAQLLSSSFIESYTNVYLTTPTNLNFLVGAAPNVLTASTLSINSACLEGVIEPFSPPNLIASVSQFQRNNYYSQINDITTQELLLALGYEVPQDEIVGGTTINSNYLSFKPVQELNYVPISVASPLYYNTFIDPNVNAAPIGNVRSALSISQYFTPSLSGNVFTPNTPEEGTYTQVRWLTFNNFSRDSSNDTTFTQYIPGEAVGFATIDNETFSMNGAFTNSSVYNFYFQNAFTGNVFTWTQFYALRFDGSITKHFNDPAPLAEKLKVPFLTVTFPYLDDNPEKYPYSFPYAVNNNVPTGLQLTDNRMIVAMNMSASPSDESGITPPGDNPIVFPFTIPGFAQAYRFCNGASNQDCLATRVLWNPTESSFLGNETGSLELRSVRSSGGSVFTPPIVINGETILPGTPNLNPFSPCTAVYNQLSDESLNHPQCSTNFYSPRGLHSDTVYSLSSYNCTRSDGTNEPQHRLNPMASVFTCKLFQWFAKYGTGSAMPITISYSYN